MEMDLLVGIFNQIMLQCIRLNLVGMVLSVLDSMSYIPEGNGGARWIPVHTLIIENQFGTPCLQDSYFRLRYSLDIFNTENLRTPQFLYKYGASYYIDGGDEGTSIYFQFLQDKKLLLVPEIEPCLVSHQKI